MALRRILLAALATTLICLATFPSARADLGDCSQPFSEGEDAVVGDCLITLRAGIGLEECTPACICDPTGDGAISALDALLCLRHVVGLPGELQCPCSGVTTTSSSTTLFLPSTSTSSSSSSTGSLPSSTSTTTTVPEAVCPVLMDLTYHAAIGGACASNADCAAGACDDGISRCTTPTDFDIGWTGRAHDQDLGDATIIATTLECTGAAGACGQCTIAGLRVDGIDACRCEDDNRRACDEPFDADHDDCGGAVCQCFFGPPTPVAAGGTPLCLLQRIAGDVLGTVDPDNGAMAFELPLRTSVFLSDDLLVPCPACGGRCTAPPESTNTACLTNSDCGAPGVGTCEGYDPIARDGARGGLCVGGPDHGFACDIDALHSAFPAPGGGGHSLDCFPPTERNVSGAGLRIRMHETTGSQSLATDVVCGFPPSAPSSCACGTCSTDTTRACASNADCDEGAACGLPAGAALPNACSDGECMPGEGLDAGCEVGPVDRFCDGVLRADGRGILACSSNGDCASSEVEAGACTLQSTRECFPATIATQGQADPRVPVLATATCVPGTSSQGLNTGLGIPGPARLRSQTVLATYCDVTRSRAYAPGTGCP